MTKRGEWRWGAFPGEKRNGGSMAQALRMALLHESWGRDMAHAVGTYAGRVFALREMQSGATRAYVEPCPCCGKPATLVGCRSGYSACEACRVQMPGESP